MTTEPTVSIVLPVYNGDRYLHEALDSVLGQTFTSWELIIVDDCSTDNTPVIANSYAAKDSRIRYIRNEVNKKLPASLNVGFSHAKGKYLTWISDDNRFGENALELMSNALDNNPEVDLVYCRMQRINEAGDLISPLRLPQNGSFIYCFNVVLACFLYRRKVQEALGGYDENLFLVEDYDFWLRAYRSFSFRHLPEAPYFYRVHSGALTSTRALDIRDKACQIIQREKNCRDLGVYKRICAHVGLAVNRGRRLLVRRKHAKDMQKQPQE